MRRLAPTVDVEVLLTSEDRRQALLHDVATGLTRTPKDLPPKWFYDERGSELFAEITRLPEYYLTRRERAILAERVHEIAADTRADTLVELGSGTSEKTRFLLDGLGAAGVLRRFVALDVSEATLRESAARIAGEYPGVMVTAIVGDFDRHLGAIPPGGRRLIAFLGSSIGNFGPVERSRFLATAQATLEEGDALLVGVDLVKEPERLVAAYDDRSGVTAEFNRNVLRVVNRELGADFRPECFDHVARWDAAGEWVELALRSRVDQRVRIPGAGLTVEFARGEELRTEISAKFRPEGVRAELAAAGFEPARFWTDAQDDFALALAVPA
ncbi:MAG: L-histidine N(alpha)-methyltransferase [Thermoleophilia bacterium]|nr:L-histidine N(alpha)-methyltransferase [Thermoleophilia bacterium]